MNYRYATLSLLVIALLNSACAYCAGSGNPKKLSTDISASAQESTRSTDKPIYRPRRTSARRSAALAAAAAAAPADQTFFTPTRVPISLEQISGRAPAKIQLRVFPDAAPPAAAAQPVPLPSGAPASLPTASAHAHTSQGVKARNPYNYGGMESELYVLAMLDKQDQDILQRYKAGELNHKP